MDRVAEEGTVKPIDIVFFDAGETIIHPYPSFPELFAQVCATRGVTVEPDDVRDVQERLAPHLIDLAEDSGVTKPSLNADDSQRFWTFLYDRFLAALGVTDERLPHELFSTFSASSTYRLFDDVRPTLLEIEGRGHRLGLISNFEGWLEQILVEQEVGESFDVTVISGVEGVEKPDPAIYELAVERAGVEPSRCVHVGDSMALDVVPASEVGINAVLLDRVGRYPDGDCPKISSLEELPSVISKL